MADTPFTALPIPRILWDSFEATLSAHVRKLAKDIATTLGQSEKPLLDAIRKEKISAYLFEDGAQEMMELSTMRCGQLVPHPEHPRVLVPCGEPIAWTSSSSASGVRQCPRHVGCRQTFVPKSSYVLRPLRVEGCDSEGTYYVNEANEIVDLDLRPRGVLRGTTAVFFHTGQD